MKKKQGVLVLILTVVLIGLLAFTTAVGFGPTGTGSAKNIKTGLDVYKRQINITERQRELATLKVLGFYDGEVASYVYRENMVLTVFGILAGVGIGAFLHGKVIRTVEAVSYTHLLCLQSSGGDIKGLSGTEPV